MLHGILRTIYEPHTNAKYTTLKTILLLYRDNDCDVSYDCVIAVRWFFSLFIILYIDGSFLNTRAKADSNKITNCPHDDNSRDGKFDLSEALFIPSNRLTLSCQTFEDLSNLLFE